METSEIMRKKTGNHKGYQLCSIAISLLPLSDMKWFNKLKRVPRKITAYLHRDKVKTVWKSDCFKDPDNYYIVLATDGTMFHLTY